MHAQASQFLRTAARVELQAEEIYTVMAETFFRSAVLRDTFVRLASEERQHAMRLRLLERHQSHLPWSPATLKKMTASLAEMSDALAVIRKELASATARRDPYAMLRRLGEVEQRFSLVHAEEAAAEGDPGVRELFAALARQDAEHGRFIAWAKSKAAA